MKKQLFSCFSLFPVALFAVSCLVGCGGKASSEDGDKIVLRVLNSADYIYEEDSPENYDEGCEYNKHFVYDVNDPEQYDLETNTIIQPKPNMTKQFEKYMKDVKGLNVSVVYDTFDTNETMFNALKLGKSKYDIIVPSDYMVQKLISHNLIQDISQYVKDTEINDHVSTYLQDIFKGIYPKNLDTNEYMKDKPIFKYSVPYMWGTVGIMYNPEFYVGADGDWDSIIESMKSWEALYSEQFKNSFSIKDSVRDVYAMSILHAFKDEIAELDPEDPEFNKKLNAIFNRCDNETLNIVKEDMMKLKANSFGFEVDSGKTDMVTGKIGANLAWSGDATWAIFQAESDYEKELYFSIPEEGSNIWFDAFAVPTVSEHPDIAVEFINFMSQPKNAIQNMWYVGYTSAVSGDDVLDYVKENYDVEYNGYFYSDVDEDGNELDEEEAILLEEAAIAEYEAEYDESGENQYDISYFFDGSADAIFYPSPDVIGRTLTAQFPEKSDLNHLCVMDDFGNQNEAVLDMWEKVRTNSLPVWAIVILVVEFLAVISVVIYFAINKGIKKSLKKQRRLERMQN